MPESSTAAGIGGLSDGDGPSGVLFELSGSFRVAATFEDLDIDFLPADACEHRAMIGFIKAVKF